MISVLISSFSDEKQKSIFENLYNLYKKQVYFIALKYLGDHHRAEDVVQTTYFKAFCNIDKFIKLDDLKIKAYMLTIAKNSAMDILKKEKTNLCVVNNQDIECLNLKANVSLEKEIIKKETAKFINCKIEDMKEIDKKILTLKYIQEKKDKEIAEELGLSHENIRVRLTRAKKRFADAILEDEKKEDIFDEL